MKIKREELEADISQSLTNLSSDIVEGLIPYIEEQAEILNGHWKQELDAFLVTCSLGVNVMVSDGTEKTPRSFPLWQLVNEFLDPDDLEREKKEVERLAEWAKDCLIQCEAVLKRYEETVEN